MSMIPIDSPLLAAYLASNKTPMGGGDEGESDGTGPTAASSRSGSNGNTSGLPQEMQYLATQYSSYYSPSAKQAFRRPESISENQDGKGEESDDESENDDCEAAYLSALAYLAPSSEISNTAPPNTDPKTGQPSVSDPVIEASPSEDDKKSSSDDSSCDGCEEAYLSAIALLDPKSSSFPKNKKSESAHAPHVQEVGNHATPVKEGDQILQTPPLPQHKQPTSTTQQQESEAGGFSWWNRWTFRDTPPTEEALNSIEDILTDTKFKEEQSHDTGSMDAQSWCTDPSLSIASSVMTTQSILSTSSTTAPIREAIVPHRNPNRYADLKASFRRRQRELILQQRMNEPSRSVKFVLEDHIEYYESPPLYDDEIERYWYTSSDYKFFQQELWAAASPYMREIIPVFAQAFRFFCQHRRSRNELRHTQGRLEEIYSYFDGQNYCIDDSVIVVGLEHILWTCARGEPKKTVDFILEKQRSFQKSSSVRNPITALAKECKAANQPTKLLAHEMAMALARTLDGDEDEDDPDEDLGALDSEEED